MAAKKQKQEKTAKNVAPPRQKTVDFVARYSNGVVIVNTQFDIQLVFGWLEFQPDKQFIVNEHTLIAMSPRHAKSLYELLGRRLKDWEKNYGAIELKKIDQKE